jgi:SPP1 gp7 family putative phage head morphogenesis protein
MEKIGKQMRDEADKKRKKDISKKEAIKRVAELTEEKKRAWWEEHDKAMGSDEKLFMSLIVNLLKSQEKRVIEGIEPNFGKDAYDVVDWEEEKMIFASVSVPVYEEIAKNRGPRAARLIGTTFEMTENIREFIDKKAFQFADQVNETTRKKLRKTLKEGVGEGEGIPDLTKRVKDIFKDRETWEAERIARTEVLSSSNGTEFEVYKESGVVEKKEWLATMDDRVRPEHAAMNGEVVGLYESFSNGLAYPAEPNCRCSVLPVIE